MALRTLHVAALACVLFSAAIAVDPTCNISSTNQTGFLCKNGDCITLPQRCDGTNDCGDNSDEKNCPGASSWVGYAGAVVAAVFFGSNFVPIKKYETGDGVFFQWIMCAGIWLVGIFVNFAKGHVPFQPLAALGGVSWTMGNMTVVPIVRAIGLAQGLLVWGTMNMIMGWAAARFGWFGIVPQVPSNTTLQYIGVMFTTISVFLYALVKTESRAPKSTDEEHPLLSNHAVNQDPDTPLNPGGRDLLAPIDRMSPSSRRILGLGLSLFSGLCYSLIFDPVQYYMDNERGASQDALNYVFSQFSGIFMTSTAFFLFYCVYTRNRPVLYGNIVLPGTVSGVMWGLAQTSWFVANQHLSQAVAYPIVTTLPGIIGTLWGTVVFGEIRGLRNYLILGVAYAVTFAGVTCIVLSQ